MNNYSNYSTLQIESFELLLQKYGNYLENIGLGLSRNNKKKLSVFKLVKNYCDKIKFLEISGRYNERNMYTIFCLIKNAQQNLNYLTIKFYQKIDSILLQNLGLILPNKLEYLRLELEFNINDLEIFFINSKNIFIKKLLIGNSINQSDDILPCIKKYIMKERRVTYLAINELYPNNVMKDLHELKDEVEEFKFYGIQVKYYHGLCIKDECNFINELY